MADVWIVRTECNADDAERAMILSDDVSDDDSIGDGAECDGDYVEPREGGSGWVEQATSDDYCCNKMDATEFLTGKDRTKWGKVKSF